MEPQLSWIALTSAVRPSSSLMLVPTFMKTSELGDPASARECPRMRGSGFSVVAVKPATASSAIFIVAKPPGP